MTGAVAAAVNPICDLWRTDIADIRARQVPGDLVGEFLVGRDQPRRCGLGAGQVETVVDRMVDFGGDLRGAIDELATEM